MATRVEVVRNKKRPGPSAGRPGFQTATPPDRTITPTRQIHVLLPASLLLGRPIPMVLHWCFVIAATPLAVDTDFVHPQTSLNLASASRCSIHRHATLLEAFEYTLGVELPLSPQLHESKCLPPTVLRCGLHAHFLPNHAGRLLRRSQDERRTEFLGLLSSASFLHALHFSFRFSHPSSLSASLLCPSEPPLLSIPPLRARPPRLSRLPPLLISSRTPSAPLASRLRRAASSRAGDDVSSCGGEQQVPFSSSHEYSVVSFADADTEEILVAYTYLIEKTATQE
ncbi:hypothetical protein K438DRAFT_2028880 [Mycena galopus ATCC 62051]|nr:hypothetical protein K438DRAFT_2028880 [Mycena galopus ATCC 62051]